MSFGASLGIPALDCASLSLRRQAHWRDSPGLVARGAVGGAVGHAADRARTVGAVRHVIREPAFPRDKGRACSSGRCRKMSSTIGEKTPAETIRARSAPTAGRPS